MRLTLFGPPASGKGTQGRRLAKHLKLEYLSTGALLRSHVEQGTEVGCIAEPILARGGYLPDDLMCEMVGQWIDEKKEGWLIDGFPRSVPQARFMDEKLASRGMALDAVVALDAPYGELLSRISNRVECLNCHWSGHRDEASEGDECPECADTVKTRSDDSIENFTSRFREYERLTQPLIDYYREKGLLCSCDGTLSRDDVTQEILKGLQPASPSH